MYKIDLWNVAYNKNKISNIPRKYKRALKYRDQQSTYIFNHAKNKNTPINLFRDFLNQPSNIINPETFIDTVKSIFQNLPNIDIQVLSTEMLQKQNLNLILSVDKLTSRMLIVKYSPDPHRSPICIVGKGVTMDTGGYALKSNKSMKSMHLDKTGGIMALYMLHNVVKKQIKDNVVVCVPLVENSISHNATKPGDIVQSFSGKSVEIVNPDVEGRLILADGISYCLKTFNPRYIIDMGTLTSLPYCNVSYGFMTMSNTLREIIKKSSEKYAEYVYDMPPWPEFVSYTKSNRADIKNSSFGCQDMFVSAIFLYSFIPDKYRQRWIHLNLMSGEDISLLEGSESLSDMLISLLKK